jgi:quercetin dioxygenase-like cupin family protein
MPAIDPNAPTLPADDLARKLAFSDPEHDTKLEHFGVVGDTYTITVTGNDTAGKFCVVDMHVPPGGGPPPHRHDFEETFVVLAGEIEATFRGERKTVKTGQTIHIPANAPHQFTNASQEPARLLCICAPAGADKFFRQIGVPVATRTTPPPRPTPEQEEAMKKKVAELLPRYRTEILTHA